MKIPIPCARGIFFDGEESNWTDFLDLYCSRIPSVDRPALEKEIEFYGAFGLLGKVCHGERVDEKSLGCRERLLRIGEGS